MRKMTIKQEEKGAKEEQIVAKEEQKRSKRGAKEEQKEKQKRSISVGLSTDCAIKYLSYLPRHTVV